MKNKKVVLFLSLMSPAFFSNANTGDITLLGSVTEATCDIELSSAGVADSVVQLGEVSTGATGAEVAFSLAPAAGSTCATLTTTTAKAADVTWASASLTNAGVANGSGTATNVKAILKAKPAAGTEVITATNPTVSFAASEASGPSASMNFTAQLDASGSGATAGTFRATLAYSVAYK
ncbi:hypothetical protein [Vibrio brasiliensis]